MAASETRPYESDCRLPIPNDARTTRILDGAVVMLERPDSRIAVFDVVLRSFGVTIERSKRISAATWR
jgi:hypothetical protein